MKILQFIDSFYTGILQFLLHIMYVQYTVYDSSLRFNNIHEKQQTSTICLYATDFKVSTIVFKIGNLPELTCHILFHQQLSLFHISPEDKECLSCAVKYSMTRTTYIRNTKIRRKKA